MLILKIDEELGDKIYNDNEKYFVGSNTSLFHKVHFPKSLLSIEEFKKKDRSIILLSSNRYVLSDVVRLIELVTNVMRIWGMTVREDRKEIRELARIKENQNEVESKKNINSCIDPEWLATV
ncbi:hypothetical protein V1478_004426 [Vespula squamosa]|uniref:Uncharacterized protein n=1 Tax=Vespula squamosa TaxID=30214 RepID=A0ABD2BG61_VESSQ